jgi:hypothetical protein
MGLEMLRRNKVEVVVSISRKSEQVAESKEPRLTYFFRVKDKHSFKQFLASKNCSFDSGGR